MTHAIPHGGRLAEARRRHPSAPTPWLDLSTGINPHGWRGDRASLEALARLPDPAEVTALEAAAARAFGCDPAQVVAVGGAEAGLRLLPDLLPVRLIAVATPTYGSHADAWHLAGAVVEAVPREAVFESRAQALLVVNPNNPDGAVTAGRDLVAAADGRWLIIDESFVEVQPDLSAVSLATGKTVVLRSFGKFYGLAGVRLGFVVCDPDLARTIRRRIGDWPVSADAVVMGQAAYADAAWAEEAWGRLEQDAARLDQMLVRSGFQVIGGTSLFRLTRSADAGRRAERLAETGILVRTFAYAPELIRFGLPGHDDWPRLKSALERL